MYKLVAVDLDGTLLNSYGEISEHTKRVVKKVMKNGVEFVLASGRSIDSIKNIAGELEGVKYIIAGNGAVTYDIKQNTNIYENYIPKDKALELIKTCEENSIFYNVYTNKTIVTNSLRYNVLYYYKENLNKEDSKKTSITIVDSIYDYVKNMQDEKIMKLFICDETESVFKSIIKKFEDMPNLETLDVAHMSRKIIKKGTEKIPIEYYYTEISMKNVDKWNAVENFDDENDPGEFIIEPKKEGDDNIINTNINIDDASKNSISNTLINVNNNN